MMTGYDQHFKRVKQNVKSENIPLSKTFTKSGISTGVGAVKSSKSAANKKRFPVISLFSFIALAGIGLLFLENFDSIEDSFKKIEFGVNAAVAEEVSAKPTTTSDSKAPDAKTGEGDVKAVAVTDAKKIDEADYMFKLAERKKELDLREEELKKLAEQIEIQKNEITEKLTKLEEMRTKISTALEEKIKGDDTKVETLVQMYTNMKPQQAAKIFETLDEDLVIEILGRMKKKNAADILNLIKPEKAQVFAERYTGYRAPASK